MRWMNRWVLAGVAAVGIAVAWFLISPLLSGGVAILAVVLMIIWGLTRLVDIRREL